MEEDLQYRLKRSPEFKVTEYGADDLHELNVFTSEVAIIACIKGQTQVMLDDLVYAFNASNNFVIIRLNHLFFNKCSDDAKVVVIEYDIKFFGLMYHMFEKEILEAIYNFNTPDLCTVKSLRASNITITKIVNLFRNRTHTNCNRYLISLTVAYILERYESLIRGKNIRTVEQGSENNRYVTLFRQLCDKHHAKERNIQVYASWLGVSTRHLYDVVKKETGLSPKQILTDYVIASAKRLLITSTLSTQQIAYALNFNEQANFTRYFKQSVGEAPTVFRKNYIMIA